MTYPSFVSSRVKWLPTCADDLLHAAIGIAGECIELAFAEGDENEREESGDIEFYLEHFRLAQEKWGLARGASAPIERSGLHYLDDLVKTGGTILDLAKKVWIYGKNPDTLDFETPLCRLVWLLEKNAITLKTSRPVLQAKNQHKLEIRYPTGYSDAAAQARADKPHGE